MSDTPELGHANTSSPWVRMVRARYDMPVTFQTEEGFTFSAQAKDMNAKGCFLFVDTQSVAHLPLGTKGFLLEELHGERITMACQIVRISDAGLGIQFLSES